MKTMTLTKQSCFPLKVTARNCAAWLYISNFRYLFYEIPVFPCCSEGSSKMAPFPVWRTVCIDDACTLQLVKGLRH